ncbi:MAG: hypothetical protein A3F73_02235 [Gallionellales bacterium RIFCSPLOWO2_12_FULL_59_22]|nr:MAG: hypothetical protein A3H99_04635 [Gallionellales bacterium RIFCSPLOWO2_02_FULL_59_110]OGT10923.1 MAG: hypothetical protein A3F73_02235 [Gallionellales bacterium RIFCSPLOWO2_12_FULL_59_22]
MESTGVYWVAAYEVLESRGISVILANAREARAVPGRKSDVNDAQEGVLVCPAEFEVRSAAIAGKLILSIMYILAS